MIFNCFKIKYNACWQNTYINRTLAYVYLPTAYQFGLDSSNQIEVHSNLALYLPTYYLH